MSVRSRNGFFGHLQVSLALALAIACGAVRGQEAAGDAAAPPVDAVADNVKAEFQKKFQAWREAIKQIDQLRIEYQSADESRRQELQQELKVKFETANAMVPGVIEAALASYDATAGKDEELSNFLVSVAAHRISSDRYEDVLPVIERLTTHGTKHAGVPMWGAIAAFAVADYEGAEKYFALSEKGGALAQPPAEEEKELWMLGMGLRELLDVHKKAWEKEQAIRAAEAEADNLPRVLLKTSKGDITIELFENEAPGTVKNFITLVEQGAYNGTAFHRVLENFMAQGGDPTTAGKPEPAYNIPCECYAENARKHFRGTLSMAHAGKDTGNAQFFLTFRPTPHLDGQTFYPGSPNASNHTVFGRVIEGIEVLADLNRVNPQAPPQEQAMQPEPDRILEAKVLRKRPETDYSDFPKIATQ